MTQVSISNPYDHVVPSLLRQVPVKDACSTLVHGLFRNLDLKSIQNGIQNCPSLNEKYSALNLTPLHFAAMANCDAAIDSLVAKKADVNAQDARIAMTKSDSSRSVSQAPPKPWTRSSLDQKPLWKSGSKVLRNLSNGLK